MLMYGAILALGKQQIYMVRQLITITVGILLMMQTATVTMAFGFRKLFEVLFLTKNVSAKGFNLVPSGDQQIV